MEIVIMIAQFVLGLSFLVGVHELGHMLFAKYFGMRVEKFSIGFPPKIFGFKKGETEYSVGALPFGGFVKISGMVDESLDTNSLSQEPQPWEFRSKPPVQRLFVMLGGIIFNVITAILINAVLIFTLGEKYISFEEAKKYEIIPTETGKQVGFKEGDFIVAINGKRDSIDFQEVVKEALLESESKVTVRRNNIDTTLVMPKNILDIVSQRKESLFELATPFSIGGMEPTSNAAKAGLVVGDRIVQVDSTPVAYFQQLKNALQGKKDVDVQLLIVRQQDTLLKTCHVDSTGKIGVGIQPTIAFNTKEYNVATSFTRGFVYSFDIIWVQLKAFSKMFSGDLDPSNSVGSFISIGKEYGGTWDWAHFWSLTATLSMVLAFMNLLPIPALDGGHVMFLMYEIISGKKPSDKFLESAQKVGMLLLFTLMIYAVFNDIVNNFFSK